MHSNEENKEESKENSFKHSNVRRRRTKTDDSGSSQPVRFEYVVDEGGEEKMVEVRRRRRRRSHQPKKVKEKRKKLTRRILIFGSIPFILLLASLYFFMLTWISGQGFRKEVSANISEILETDVEFGAFNLDGLNLNARNTTSVSNLSLMFALTSFLNPCPLIHVSMKKYKLANNSIKGMLPKIRILLVNFLRFSLTFLGW
jgi:hypothetical protein